MVDEGGRVVIHGLYDSNAHAERCQYTQSVGWPDIVADRTYKGKVAPFRLDQAKITIILAPDTSFYVLVNQLIICSANRTDCGPPAGHSGTSTQSSAE
jgi:hypothetical protein